MAITSTWSGQEISLAIGVLCSVFTLLIKGTDIIDYFLNLKINKLSKLKLCTSSQDLQEVLANQIDDCIYVKLTGVSDPSINRELIKLLNLYSNTIEKKHIEFYFSSLLYTNGNLKFNKKVKYFYLTGVIMSRFMMMLSFACFILYILVAVDLFLQEKNLGSLVILVFSLMFAALTRLYRDMFPKKNIAEFTIMLDEYNARSQQ